MKKMIGILAALMVLSCELVIGGTGRPVSYIAVIEDGEIFKVIYDRQTSSVVKVTIANEKGEEVFSEKIKSTDGFIRPYNFSLLPKGDYTIAVTDGEGENVEKVCYHDQYSKLIAHVGRITGSDKKYIVSIPYQGEGKEVIIRIYTKDQEVVYNEKVSGAFAQVYNLKELDSGATFSVTNESGEEKIFKTEVAPER